ncbi:MAG: acyl-CoA thioesterase [Proteobacteria bacterium]|nr:acyl-CoA thioesterase [Pseudomonadota bacterium]
METYLPPNRFLAIRTIAMPADTNPHGDIFGGWLVAQMDMAGANIAAQKAQGRVTTVAIDSLSFHKPVFVGDEVSCYGEIIRLGRSSLTVQVDVWVRRALSQNTLKVTEGTFTYVAIDEEHRPREVPKS